MGDLWILLLFLLIHEGIHAYLRYMLHLNFYITSSLILWMRWICYPFNNVLFLVQYFPSCKLIFILTEIIYFLKICLYCKAIASFSCILHSNKLLWNNFWNNSNCHLIKNLKGWRHTIQISFVSPGYAHCHLWWILKYSHWSRNAREIYVSSVLYLKCKQYLIM